MTKHRLFVWLQLPTLADAQLIVFARSDDCFFGLLHSRLHEVWARAQGTQLRERESGFRYTPTTCFETFPFPRPTEDVRAAIAEAARELNELRENWLNPPEWTTTQVLEFPGTVGGPWSRYIEASPHVAQPPSAVNSASSSVSHEEPQPGAAVPHEDTCTPPRIGLVRYPRLVPKDDACAAKLKKRTLTNLYNQRPTWLDLAHRKLDEAVCAAYGWPPDLSDEQILERLLALNLERAAEEASE